MIKKLCESQDIEKKVSVAFDLVVPVTMTESDVQDLIIEALSDKDVEVSSYMEVHDSELTESVSNLKRYDIDSMDSLIVSGLPQKFSNVRDGGSGNSNSYKIIGTPDEIKGVLAYCKSKGVKPRSTKVTPKDIKWYNNRESCCESVKLSGNFKKDVADITEAIDSLQVPTEEGSYKYVLSELNKIKKAVDSWIKDIRY